ncbi:MAG: hypothetical protein EYC62_06770 [Alphaproteobacteria bacterium]|nr:MAG: hypothetical protein EYC62_06770 [Alphaproteobacteria bacterium]
MPVIRIVIVLLFLYTPLAYADADLPGGEGAADCSIVTMSFPGYTDVSKITFEFATPRPCGQFVDGSYWVVAPVTIKRMTPDFTADGDNARNGFAVDPNHYQNNFDSRAAGFSTPDQTLPITINGADKPVSIIKSSSRAICRPNCLNSAAILTVLPRIPEKYSFRPPYVMGDKPIYTVAQLDLPALPKLPVIPATPDLADLTANFNGPWIELGLPQVSPQALRPRANLNAKTESVQISNMIVSAALFSLQDIAMEKRLKVLAPLIQYGIDQYGLLQNGRMWFAQTDRNLGHKLPILIAGRMLKNAGMYHIGFTHSGIGAVLPYGKKVQNYFQEDGHTFIGNDNFALFGATYGLAGGNFGGKGAFGYDHYLLHSCDKGPSDIRDPDGYRDGGAINDHTEQLPDANGEYHCAAMPLIKTQIESGQGFGNRVMEDIARPYVATATAARMWGLEKMWNWTAFFAFTERWHSAPWNNMGRSANPYAETMRGLYYANNDDGFVKPVTLAGNKSAAPIVYKPIPGIDDNKPLPGPDGLMRQILDIMYHGGSIRDLGEFLPE